MNSRNSPRKADLFLIEETREDRMSRVEDIRRRLSVGDYDVPAEDVAEAVFAFFSRTLPPILTSNPGASDDTC